MTEYHTVPMPIPSWLIIDAFRYALGRSSTQVTITTRWLVGNWEKLPQDARKVIQRDLEEEFARHERSGQRWLTECDRQEWEQVRALWAKW